MTLTLARLLPTWGLMFIWLPLVMSLVVIKVVLSLSAWCLGWDLGLNCVSACESSLLLFEKKNKWESVGKRRKNSRLIMLCKCLKGKPIYPQMTCFPQACRKHLSLPLAWTNIYPRVVSSLTLLEIQTLADSLISIAECGEDSVTKLTSLIKAKQKSVYSTLLPVQSETATL